MLFSKKISNPSPKKVAYSPYPEYLPIDGMNNGNYDRKGNHSRLKPWFPKSDNSQRMQNEKANCFDNNPVYSNCGAVLKLLQ